MFIIIAIIVIVFLALYYGVRRMRKRMTTMDGFKKRVRLFYCSGDAPSDDGPYWFLEEKSTRLLSGDEVLVVGKPKRPNRRPKVATYVGVLRKDPMKVVLVSSTGRPFQRHWTDILKRV